MQVTKNIYFKELVSTHYLQKIGDVTEGNLRFLDIGLLSDMQKIREYFDKPLIINDHEQFNWRGLRTPEWEHYNPESMHAWWRAYDFHIEGYEVEEVRQHIIKFRDEKYQNISAIEDKVNWIHVDSRYIPNGELLVFDP